MIDRKYTIGVNYTLIMYGFNLIAIHLKTITDRMKARLFELDLLNGESTLEKHTHVYVRGVLL